MNNYNKYIAVFLLLIFGLSACSIQMHAPQPSYSTKVGKNWQLRCEVTGGDYGNRWLWAKHDGRSVSLSGRFQDGFLVLDSAQAKQQLRDYCKATVADKFTTDGVQFIAMQAARPKELINVPIVFTGAFAANGGSVVNRWVLFGDSLSDTGRLKDRLQIFPGDPYWQGRLSNGPVWVDYLTAFSDVSLLNFSYAGAFTVDHESIPSQGFGSRIMEGGQLLVSGSIELQVDDYIQYALSNRTLAQPQNTGFIIWAGANDYISKEPITGVIDTFLNAPDGSDGYQQIVDETINALQVFVEKLYNTGGRNFVLIDMPDLGHTPIVIQNETYMIHRQYGSDEERQIDLSLRLSELSQYHNSELEKAIANLRDNFSDARIEKVSMSEHLAQFAMAKPALEYGFTDVDEAVQLKVNQQALTINPRCYAGGYLGSNNASDICVNQTSALFWDVVHPTSYAHCWLAYLVADDLAGLGLFNQPNEPSVYNQWCEQVGEELFTSKRNVWLLDSKALNAPLSPLQ